MAGSRLSLFIFVLVALTGCVAPKLNVEQTTAFDVDVRSAVGNTSQHPPNEPFVLTAGCLAGETLIGGGVRLINNDNRYPNLVVIEGSYPSDLNSWSVQARNPDNPTYYNGDADVIVMSLAYCMTKPSLGIQTEIVKAQASIPKTANVSTDIDIRCSTTDALALSGGFLTSTLPVYQEPGGGVREGYWGALLGSGIQEIGPRLPDATHSSMGWHASQVYTPANFYTAPQPTVTTTVFALCAHTGINRQSYRIETTSKTLSPATPMDPMASSNIASCSIGEFTVGGGYRMTAPIAPSSTDAPQVDGDLANGATGLKFTGWEISGNSVGKPLDASALCIRIPVL